MLIGQKLKNLRERQKISLTELSKRSGVQLATLSRIENLKMTGTLESHMAIAQALGANLVDLYSDIKTETAKAEVKPVSAEPGADVFRFSDSSSYEILTNKVLTKKMMPILLKIEPGGKTNREENAKGTEKFVFVLSGKVKTLVAEEAYMLEEGSSLYFDASSPHWFENIGKTQARLIAVVTPVVL